MNLYYIYGFKVASNITLINAPVFCDQRYNTEVCLEFINIPSINSTWTPRLSKTDDGYILRLGDHIVYSISEKDRKITAYATDPIFVESTIFNLPFAVYAMLMESLLLHASVLVFDNNLIPIFAPKGTGKTTLSAALSEFFYFFSDDTLYASLLDGNISTDAGSFLLKMNKDSAAALNNISTFTNKVNIQNKNFYLPIKKADYKTDYKINSLFFLSRSKQKDIEVKNIDADRLKALYLHANVCGAETLGFEYCKYIRSNKLFKKMISDLKFYKLSIPDGLDNLSKTAKELSNVIKAIL